MKDVIKSVIYACLLLFICNTIVLTWYVWVPYTWTLTGETIQDSTAYTGSYYNINDSLRIYVVKSTVESPTFDEYTIYKLEMGETFGSWDNTGVSTYIGTHDSKLSMIFYIKNKYIRHNRNHKARKNGSVLN